jgi:hypothetical protein
MVGGNMRSICLLLSLSACLPRGARELRGELQDVPVEPSDDEVPAEEPSDEPSSENPDDLANGPVAVCAWVDSVVNPPYETVLLDGSNSYDPDRMDFTLEWTLNVSPEGSSATIESGTQDSVNFSPDLIGLYVAQLTATNSIGLVDQCKIVFSAVPSQGLWIEMHWSLEGDDLDLHLISPGLDWSSYIGTGEDCHWSNCTSEGVGLDWGVEGNSSDDPHLALDDSVGTGPETMYVEVPESGEYTLVVHDYGNGAEYDGSNEVTLTYYLWGVEVFSEVRTISGEDSFTPVATINPGLGIVESQ